MITILVVTMWNNTCLHVLDAKTDEFAALELCVHSVILNVKHYFLPNLLSPIRDPCVTISSV